MQHDMQHAFSVSAQFTREVVNAYQRMGYALTTTTTTELSGCSGDRIRLATFCEILHAMEQQSEQPDIGLLLGKAMEPACFTVLGHLVMASDTVGEALSYVAQLQPLIIDCAASECCTGEQQVDFYWNPVVELPVAEKILIDLVLSATRHFGIWATGIAEPFTTVSFRYPEPANRENYESVFGTPGRFSQHSNGFSIPRSWYDRPIRSANHDLKPLIFHKAEQLLKSLQGPGTIIEQLQTILEELLPEGNATIETAAAAIHMTPRTLQRHLQEWQTSFSEVLQEVRFRRANFLLIHTDFSLTDIAMQVGYREQSSFSNAYKHWAGFPPRQMRLKALG